MPVRILHLEDNSPDQLLVKETLASSGLPCEIVHVAGQQDFEALLQNCRFDLIISDFSLPGYDGMAALASAQKSQPGTPFLFVSGTIGEERAVESLKCGAIDYVLKDNLHRLVPSVKRALRESREREQRQRLEQQLRQAQKMEAVGQLAGGVAHDFNNLLAVICGNVELVLLRDEPVSKESLESLKQVLAAAGRAANLTRQLLAFGRKQPMRAEPVNLNEVITNLAKLLKRVIGASIVLECAFPELLAYVEADASMMEQVLLNLVVNSRDAMPRGGQLLITTERVVFADTDTGRHPDARAGEFICWAVSDTGCGIAPEHLPRIFEPFYTTKEPGKGTGLGLAMVYGIVKQHRGWVELQTQPGVGTTFQIFLPAIAAPATAKHAESSAATLHGGSERILLVENDPAVRLLTRRLLETFGYHVLEATSGNDAWELSSRAGTNVDLLLTGLVTTDGMTGPVLAQRLRKKTPHLKVIFVSGNSRESTNYDTAFLRRNQDRFLQKPYASQVLLGMVRRCLDGEARGIGAQAT